MKAGKTVQTILNLAGFKNIKSKVINYQTESIVTWIFPAILVFALTMKTLDRSSVQGILTTLLRFSSKLLMQ
jgi:ribosomal protein S5